MRQKKGQPPLPLDTIDTDVKQMVKKLLEEIEERRLQTEKLDSTYKKRQRDEEELKRMQEEYDKESNKEWESYRDKRVKNWCKFKDRNTNGRKRGRYETKPPKYKMEERIDDTHLDIFRPNTII